MTIIEDQIERALSEGIVLAGRRFARPTETTFEHDWYVMSQLRASGLLSVAQRFDPLHDDVNDLTATIIMDAYSSGRLFTLLAGVLVEEGVPWTSEGAAATGAFFKTLTGENDKAALREVLPWVLLNFFLNADVSWRIFLKYSHHVEPGGPLQQRLTRSVERGIMETGTPSSEPLRAETPAGFA